MRFHDEGLHREKNYFDMFFFRLASFVFKKNFKFLSPALHILLSKNATFLIIFVGKIFFLQYIYGFTSVKKILSHLGKTSMKKKTFSFGHCPNEGGGGLPMPEFFGPLFRSAFLVNKKSLFLQKKTNLLNF